MMRTGSLFSGALPMADEKNLRNLIRWAYECALDSTQWSPFLEALSASIGAHSAGLLVDDIANQEGRVDASHNVDPFWTRLYAQHYVKLNVWTTTFYARGFAQPGRIYECEEILPISELTKTEFYNDFLRPQDCVYVTSSLIAQEDGVNCFLSTNRGRAGRRTPESARGMLTALAPHLQTGLRLHRQIAGLNARLDYASAALDRVPGCMIVTDSRGRVLHMNRRAEAFLNSRQGLSISPEGLSAGAPRQTTRLREFIARTANTVTADANYPGGIFRLERAGREPLKLQITPLAVSSQARTERRPAVAIFVPDTAETGPPDAALLGASLDLTPAEARLTAALAGGKSLRQYAKESKISVNTAYAQLYRAFSKTGVSRQAELVRLALTRAGGS